MKLNSRKASQFSQDTQLLVHLKPVKHVNLVPVINLFPAFFFFFKSVEPLRETINIYANPLVAPGTIDGKGGKREIRLSYNGDE